MKVTVDLTDEQADAVIYEWPRRAQDPTAAYHQATAVLRDAIVAARPQPLKVGDEVRYGGYVYKVTAVIQSAYSLRWFLIAERFDIDGPLFLKQTDSFYMADGSPIVWPE